MCRRQCCTGFDVGLHVFVIHGRDVLVRQQDHDDICTLDGFSDFLNLVTSLLGLAPRSTILAQTDGHVDAGLLQVLGVGVALGAITNNSHLLALDQGEVRILIVKNLHFMPF